MKTTLLIMAAGIGSRFGTGIKQLEPVDDAGHIIMDYSIHDAIEAGFNHVVFIIRKDIEKEFKEVIGDRIASICSSHNVTVEDVGQKHTEPKEPPADPKPSAEPTPQVEPPANPGPVLDMDGKTEDGSIPYNILMKQLECMK